MSARRLRLLACAAGAVVALTATVAPEARQKSPITVLYDSYWNGDTDVVRRTVTGWTQLNALSGGLGELTNGRADQLTEKDYCRRAVFLLELAGIALEHETDPVTIRQMASTNWLSTVSQWALGRGRVASAAGPVGFERLWHRTAVAWLLGVMSPDRVDNYLDAITKKQRVEDPRFALARAMAQEQRTAPQVLGDRLGSASPSLVIGSSGREQRALDAALRLFDVAAADPDSRPEAMVRRGFLLYRAGKGDEAIAALAQGHQSRDVMVAYWSWLFEGRAADRLNQPDRAETAFRNAVVAWPGAQSPLAALGALYLRQNQRSRADQAAEAVRANAPDASDPWWIYWGADYRLIPEWLKTLREAGQ